MSVQPIHFLAVDYQNDFAGPQGRWYKPRPCHTFIEEIFCPALCDYGKQLSEIISDYRLPRPSETIEYCVPGTVGYESRLPDDIKTQNRWIKSMNSPVWVRNNDDKPYSDPSAFSSWLEKEIGNPTSAGEVVIFGLTLDCCVLCLAQELYFRGYKARYLVEAVDTYNGSSSEKEAMLRTPLPMWGVPISWDEVKARL